MGRFRQLNIGDVVELRCDYHIDGLVGIVKDVDPYSDPLVVVVMGKGNWIMGEEMVIGRSAWRKVGHIDA